MSTLIGRMSDALADADEVSYSTEQEPTHPAETLIETVAEFLNADRQEQLREVLRNENGLAPTSNALEVIMAAIKATDDLDAAWTNMPATPTVDAYRDRVILHMQNAHTADAKGEAIARLEELGIPDDARVYVNDDTQWVAK